MVNSLTRFEDDYIHAINKLTENPLDFLLRKKAAFLSLFLGKIEEAYHWSVSLNFYDPLYTQSTRQKRISLYQGKSKGATPYSVTQGIFCLRQNTSKNENLPSEEKVWRANPKRQSIIKSAFNWEKTSYYQHVIFSKTSIKHIKEGIAPFAYEPGASMDYDESFKSIPKKIIGYWYYSGFIQIEKIITAAVFRIPEFPQNDQEIEFFTEEDISKNITGGTQITCYFSQKPEILNDAISCKINMHSVFARNTQQFGSAHSFYQAHEEWNIPGQRPTLERITQYSLDKWISKEHDVLDIGCNIGIFGIELSNKIAHYTGFDANPELIEIAQILAKYKKANNCSFSNTDFNRFITSNNKQYDFILSFAVHGWIGMPIKDYSKILKNILKPQGCVLIESHDVTLEAEEKKFTHQMKCFIENGFLVKSHGTLKDDGKRKRAFYIFQKNH